jgi:hypothetical protein
MARATASATSGYEVSGKRQMQDLGRPGDRFCAPMEGWAPAVAPLVLVMHGVLHAATKAKADSEVGGNFTVCRHGLVRHRAALGNEGGQPGGQAGIQPQPAHGPGRHATGTTQVDQVQVEPGHQFIVGEERGQHHAAGTASHVLEQGPLEDGLHTVGP